MSHLKSLLKPQTVQTLPGNVSVAVAAEMMSAKRIGSVIITHGDRPVGIFTERDLLNRVIAADKDPKHTSLESVMTGNVTTVTPMSTVNDCYKLMKDIGCRHLPVVDNGEIVAIVSIRHVLGWTIDALKFERDQLQEYITT